jgi:MFS transporter, AAHS family, 4-hydroxybenzoate transporter
MAEAYVSVTENALENQRIGALQIGVVAICTLIQMCDGYDVGSIGWAVPSLTHVWNLPPPAFSTAFVWSSVGVMAGALAAGPIGDRVGRKPLLLASVAIFGLASLLSVLAGSLAVLSVWRFFTGFGIGGAFSGTVALTGDYTPQRLRATMIMVQFTGAVGRLCRRSGSGGAAGAFRLGSHFRYRRRVPAGSAAGHGLVAAGIAAFSRSQAEFVAA